MIEPCLQIKILVPLKAVFEHFPTSNPIIFIGWNVQGGGGVLCIWGGWGLGDTTCTV